MAKPIINVEWFKESNDRVCGCCRNEAHAIIHVGLDFGSFSQTTSIPLCYEHADELKYKL